MINTYKKGKGWIKHSEAYTEDELKKIYDIGHPKIAPYLNLAPLKTLPSSYIPQSTQIPVNDQGQYGCCTGEAAVGMMQCFELINDGAFTKLSPLFNYWFSRYILNGKVPTSDDGSTILAAMQALVNYGNAPELDWPITSPLEGKPSTKAQTDAKAYNVLKYFTISESTVSDPTKNTEILSLKQLLYSNSPVMFGCDVHDSIMNVGSDGLEPYAPENSKTDPIDGAHVIFSSLIELGNIVRTKCHYGYYFNGQKSLDQEIQSVIDSINGVNQGLKDEDNCVDWAQFLAAIGREMGYTVTVYGIYCTGDKIWHAICLVQGKEFKNPTWIDFAAMSKSNYPIGAHWCSGQLVKEPSWIPTKHHKNIP